MAFGLDYVTGPPIADMKAAGVTFVCRYLSYVNNLTQIKLLTPPEAQALSQAGISIVSNYEWYATRAIDDGLGHPWTPGQAFSVGEVDAQIAARQHTACGGSPDRPIYFSVDVDVSGAQCIQYFQGVASVIGKARTGAYGSYRLVGDLFNMGLITWGWQTYAWSGVQWEPRAHIQQYLNGVSMSGHSVDYDRSSPGVSDFGQWRVTTMIDLSMPGVSPYFTQAQTGGWLSTHTQTSSGQPVYLHGEILQTYQTFHLTPGDLAGLTWWGLPLSNEIPLPGSKYGATKQNFENVVAFFDPGHEFDSRPGVPTARVYLAHLYSGPGVDPKVAELEAQLTAATQPTGLPADKVATRLQAIGMQSKNGDAAIQQLVTQAIA